MAVTSVGSREAVRFGEENVPQTEEDLVGIAHNSIDLDETQEYVEHAKCKQQASFWRSTGQT